MESAAAAAVPSPAGAEDRRTRDRVSALLLEHGPQTAAELAVRLGVSPAAVRRHLDALLAAGRIAEGIVAEGRRGRPARRFALTDAGRASFPHAYDDLALTALRFVSASGGPDAVRQVAELQLAELEHRCAAAVEQAERAATAPVDRAKVVAAVLTTAGYAAMASTVVGASSSGSPTAGGGQLCQHHCPVAHVATEFPQLCEAETALIGRLVGTHVQRLATIAHGDGICTTHIPAGNRSGNRSGNKAPATTPVPADRAPARAAAASTSTTPSIDRERTSA